MYIASLAGDMDGESEGTEYRQASPDPPICAEVHYLGSVLTFLVCFSIIFGSVNS